jgi:tetratricopeptide (TPR) repeat protein
MADINRAKNSVQWLIRTETGKQIGPYSTEAVLKLISEGAFTGVEQIKRYPDGKWTVISRQPDFYDKLLEALEEVGKPRQSPRQAAEKFEAETVISPLQKKDDEETKPASGAADNGSRQPKTPAKKLSQLQQNPTSLGLPPTIEMSRVSTISRKEKFDAIKLPLFLAFAAIVLVFVALIWPSSSDRGSDRPHLILPRMNSTATITAAELKQTIQKAIGFFVQDDFESNIAAENLLVSAVEGASSNVEARGTLCLVYKELWPFVSQDSKDYETIGTLAKSTRSIDPIGINGTYCEIVRLMTLGKYKEARGVVEYALNQSSMATAPVLYALKAELLYEAGDYQSAALYMEKANQLWPEWTKPLFDLGRFETKLRDPAKAADYFQKALQRNPRHKRAQIEYGSLLFRDFKRSDEAEKILLGALASSSKIPRLDEASANFYLALIDAEKRNLKSALSYAQKAYQLNPGDAQTKDLLVKLGGDPDAVGKSAKNSELVFLGDQNYRTGNCLAAQAEYKSAFDLDHSNAIAAMKAAKCLWQLNQSAEAIDWLNKARRADPKLVAAYTLQADYYSARYDSMAATQILNEASRRFPNNYEVLRGYGLVEFRRNNVKDAIAFLQRANKIYENDVDTVILLAKAEAVAKDFPSAQKYAVRAIELDPTNPESQIIYAQVLTQMQGLETGVVYLNDLITKFSYTIEFRLALADLYKENEKFPEAQKIYSQIIDADPNNKKARMGLGECYRGMGQMDMALKEFLNAAVLDPSDADGLFHAGLVYMDLGRYKEAVTQFSRAATVNQLFPKLHYYIGRAFFQNGEYQKALESALEERKINPNLADSYILAAEIYAANKQFQKCAGEYQQAVKLRPQGAEIYVKMARCYRQAGSADIAENMLNIAASQESGLPDIYEEQGAIYEQRGDKRAAVQAYNKYLTLSPNAPDRHEIESRILSLGGGN